MDPPAGPGEDLRTVPACVVQIDADGRYVFANDRAEAVLGVAPAELTGRTYDDPGWAVSDLDGNPIPDAELPYRQVRDAGEPLYGYRHRIEWPDGTRKVVQVNAVPVFDDGETLESVVLASTDITDRRDLQRVKDEYEMVFETAQDAIFLFDVERSGDDYEFRLRRLNPAHEAISGLSTAEDRGKTPRELLGEAAGAAVAENYRRCVEAAGPIAYEEELEMPTGTTHWRTKLGPVVRDGEVTQIVGVARDISERKARERELERQNERLDEFIGVVSHDLRNPLTVANGRLELAQEECDSDHLPAAATALDRMETLIDDMLSLARAGESVGDTETVNLPDVVEGCWRIVESASADLVVEAEGSIQADATRLQQLLENLLANAVEHGGDAVTVTVGDLPGGFFVEDDGPGIPADERIDVLEPGYTTSEGGSGFGLSIVQDIAEAHGWRVEVTASAGGGARFEVTGVRGPE